MPAAKVAATFLVILTAATTAAVSMMALLVQFQAGAAQAVIWRSLVFALGGAGAALALVATLHLAFVAGRRAPLGHAEALNAWARVWDEVIDGAPPPVVPRRAALVASEAAALVLQNLVGDGADAVRDAVAASGVSRADLAAAGRLRGGRAVAALERLAWLAIPEALPLFLRAARGADERTAHAGMFGACRVLAGPGAMETAVRAVAEAIEAHSHLVPDPSGARPFIAAAIVASGSRAAPLCTLLLSVSAQESVRAAAFDALGSVQPPKAEEIVGRALAAGLEGEVEAAALRALARFGSVVDAAVPAVVRAARSPHEGVRVQAAHALVGVPVPMALTVLWRLLGDRSYEVRLASATALQRCGQSGDEALQRAARSHEDAFARNVAAMMGSLPKGNASAGRIRSLKSAPASAYARA